MTKEIFDLLFDDTLAESMRQEACDILNSALDTGAELDFDKDAALRWALVSNQRTEFTDALIKRGADPKIPFEMLFKNKLLSHQPVAKRLTAILKTAIETGADLDFDKDKALGWFVWQRYDAQFIKSLLDRGADVHASNDYAIRTAAGFNRQEVLQLLLERGANPYAVDPNNPQDCNPLTSACWNGKFENVNCMAAHIFRETQWRDKTLEDIEHEVKTAIESIKIFTNPNGDSLSSNKVETASDIIRKHALRAGLALRRAQVTCRPLSNQVLTAYIL